MRSASTLLRCSSVETQLFNRGFDLILNYCSDLNIARVDPGLFARISEVAAYVRGRAADSQSKTHRVHLDAIAIAMCMFAIRSLGREIRRGRIPNLVWPTDLDCNRLLAKLEKHRKRAKRIWLRRGDRPGYRDQCWRWQRFLRWVKESLSPIRTGILSTYVRRRLDRHVVTVKRVLTKETTEELPPDRELRKLVSAMCRHVRRERAPITMKDIAVCSDSGREFIASYMPKLIAKFRAKEDSPSVVQTASRTALTA